LTDLNFEKPIEPEIQLPKKTIPVAQVRDMTIKIVPDVLADVIPEQKIISESAISNVTVEGAIPEDISKGVSNNSATGTAAKEDKLPEQNIHPIEVQPSFPGGPEALALFFSRTLSSPGDLQAGEKKLILVRFEVGADGSITRTEIIQSGGDTYDREVLRAFKRMPRWNPAIQNGTRVATSFTQPVTFIGEEQ
jgi:protein TonB